MILIAILIPGLSFVLRGKILSAIVAFALQIAACFLFLVFGLGFILWLILAIWAVVSLNNGRNDAKLKQME
jgi:hypothetical protein